MSTQNAPAIQTTGLGKRYGSRWALQDCSVSVPRGHVSALVGPNGAGKTTLLKILAGLSAPSTGEAAVLGRVPRQTGEFLDSIGYLAQDVPLYKRLSADDHLGLGAHLNRRWDAAGARARLAALRIPADRPVATLSGGQRAQVGLSLALAKRPQLLLLDEPVAALDPLARREFLASLTEAVALGIAAGALFRRVLPAMAATFTVFTGLRFLIAEYARPHYLTPVSGRPGLHRRSQHPGRSRSLPRERPARPCAAEFLPGVPRVSHADPLPAREQVLGLPEHRGGHLHRAGRRASRCDLPHGPGPGCVSSQDR